VPKGRQADRAADEYVWASRDAYADTSARGYDEIAQQAQSLTMRVIFHDADNRGVPYDFSDTGACFFEESTVAYDAQKHLADRVWPLSEPALDRIEEALAELESTIRQPDTFQSILTETGLQVPDTDEPRLAVATHFRLHEYPPEMEFTDLVAIFDQRIQAARQAVVKARERNQQAK